MKIRQNDVFFDFEGDNYYQRNKEVDLKKDMSKDIPLRLIKKYSINPKKVLEIGCSFGFRLNKIKEKYNSECYGIEPSLKAVENGKKLFKDITLIRGVFSDIPFQDHYDLIIVNFVFHWIDRDMLSKCICEVERLLSPGGYLLIGDFYPDFQRKNRYVHIKDQEIWTYKQDYSQPFIALGNYSLIALLTTSYSSQDYIVETDDDQRVFYCLLRKKDMI